MIHRSSRRVLVFTTMAAAACDGGGGTGPGPGPQASPIVLQIAGGDGQAGLPGEELFQPLTVRATRDGQPVPNVALAFAATDGAVNLTSRTTNAEGEAGVLWTLPADESRIAGARVSAKLSSGTGTDSVLFTARALRRDEMDLVIAEGGAPVRMLVYDAGAFSLNRYTRRDFTDSVRVRFRDPELHDEIAAFTPGRAPLLVAPAWTPAVDTVRLQFATEVIRIPLTIWVVQPPFDSTAQLVQRHLKAVEDSWEAQAGIGLQDVRIVDATGFAGAARFQNTIPEPACDPSIHAAIGRDTGRLNAYYVGQPPIGSAAYCGGGWIMIFPLSWQRTGYTLAHEIGHGFLGGHHETISDNIMHFQGAGTRFSAGQMFRAHYWSQSILNTMFNAHPETMRRPCTLDPTSTTPVCPPTSFVLD